MAKRRTAEPSGAPGRKATKQKHVSPPKPSTRTEEAKGDLSDPRRDSTAQTTRRSGRLNKATEIQPKEAEIQPKQTEPQTEGDNESWQEAWENRIQTILKSDNILMHLKAERDEDPIGHREKMDRGKAAYGLLYDSGGELRVIDKEELSKLFKQLNWWIENFAEQFVVDDPDLLDQRLSGEQKDRLIERLDGYCLQIGWNGLKEQLHPATRQYLPRLVARAMLAKQMFAMIQDPFFWVGDGNGNVELAGLRDLVYPSMDQLRNLYKWLQRVHDWEAYHWRCITVTGLISETMFSSEQYRLGQALTKLREVKLETCVADLLHPSNPLHLLLSQLDDEKSKDYRYLAIKDIVSMTRDLSLAMAVRHSNLEYRPFPMLPAYHESLDYVHLDFLYHHEKIWNLNHKVTPPARRGVLFMLSPALTEQWTNGLSDQLIENLLRPAVVITSKGPPETIG